MPDLCTTFLKIPVAGASLPVLAVLCISIYGKNPFLTLASIILGIGHIGIHLQYQNMIKKDNQYLFTYFFIYEINYINII